jgi:hypothetical protein
VRRAGAPRAGFDGNQAISRALGGLQQVMGLCPSMFSDRDGQQKFEVTLHSGGSAARASGSGIHQYRARNLAQIWRYA